MGIELTDEQLATVKSGKPVRLSLPDADLVLLRADAYERLGRAYDDRDFSPREAYPFVDRVMAEDDANDPSLESYQKYRRQP